MPEPTAETSLSHLPDPGAALPGRLSRLALAVCALLLFLGGLGAYPLLEPDEGRYGEIPREMLARHDFVTPRLDGVLYFEKPPLYYWLNAAALSVLEDPETACRLASALFGLAGVGLAWRLGRSMGGATGGNRVALLSALVLGSSPLWVALARANIIDMTLTFFLTATLTCFWLAQEREKGEPGERLFWYGMFVAAALATLAKGLIGFVIPGAVIFFYLLFTRRWRLLARVPWVTGVALFLLVAVPWHVLAARRNPDFAWFYFVHEHFLRYATPEAKRQKPFWFFIAILLAGMLPWSGLLPAALLRFRRRFRGGDGGRLRDQPHLVFLACWAGFVFLFFSASHSKLVPYILPAVPPLAVLIALALAAVRESGDERLRRWLRAGGLAGALVLAALAAAFLWASFGQVPLFASVFTPSLFVFALPALAVSLVAAGWWWRQGAGRFRNVVALAAASALIVGCLCALGPRVSERLSAARLAGVLAGRIAPGDEVYAYRCYPQTLPFYLGRLVGAVDLQGELEFGLGHLPPAERARRFPSPEQFRPIWSSGRTVYLVLEDRKLPRMRQDGLAPGTILVRQDKYLLMINHPVPPRNPG
jgi:4-amino-4-deoxy-L-arabinose transferase-like glycosyltransferase